MMEKSFGFRHVECAVFGSDSVGLVVVPRLGPVVVFPGLFRPLRAPAQAVIAELVLYVAAFLAELGVAPGALEDLHDFHAADLADGHFPNPP